MSHIRRRLFRLVADILVHLPKPRPVPHSPHVLHITPQYFSDESTIGGGERYPLELARAMAELVPTVIVSFGRRRQSVALGKCNFEVYPVRRWHATRERPLSLRFLRQVLRADLVHCHQFHYRSTVITILAARLLRRPIFVTDLGGRSTSLSDSAGLLRFVCKFLNVSAFAAAWTKTELRSEVIYGGVDSHRFCPSSPPLVRDRFLFVGRLLPHKGIDTLIHAAGDDLPITIVGRPYDEHYYQDLKLLAEGKQINFIVTADDTQLRELYHKAIAIILPSVYTDMYGNQHPNAEYLGLTLLEGMACGAPAICTAVGGMPEVVEDRVTGLVVQPSDPMALRAALLELWSKPELAQAMGRRAVERVREEFTWERVAERCLQAYHNC
ncbi:MAG: glycosyltransferase family 4 protein [Herpetosiphonaceae bacterium]|nr:glycosyltransferase family 4 protein [Herpetosiphonaceae bacterium]